MVPIWPLAASMSATQTSKRRVAFNFSATFGLRGRPLVGLDHRLLPQASPISFTKPTRGRRGTTCRCVNSSRTTPPFVSLEVEARVVAVSWPDGLLALNAFFDAGVRRKSTPTTTPTPHAALPPDRLGVGATLENGPFTAALDYTRAFKQTETAAYELPTTLRYDDLRARLAEHRNPRRRHQSVRPGPQPHRC